MKAQSLGQLQSLVRKSGGKATAILLSNSERIQTDMMITRYGKSVHDCKVKALKAAQAIGFENVLRLKIEEQLETVHSLIELKDGEYFECHAEALEVDEDAPDWLVGSSNLLSDAGVFLNFRARDLNELTDKWAVASKFCSDRNVHLEVVRYDSNPNHDSWWA